MQSIGVPFQERRPKAAYGHLLPQGEKGRKPPRPDRHPPPRLTETSIEPILLSQRLTTGGDTILRVRSCRRRAENLRERNHAYCCEPPCRHQPCRFYGV